MFLGSSVLSNLNQKQVKKSNSKSHNSVVMYEFDKEVYEDIYKISSTMQQSVSEGAKIVKTFPSLSEDIFASLYKYKPQLKDDSEIEHPYNFNKEIMEQVMSSTQFNNLRLNTRLDDLASAIGLEVIQKEAIERISDIKEQMNKKHEYDPEGNPVSGDEFFNTLNDIQSSIQQINQSNSLINSLDNKSSLTKEEIEQLTKAQSRLKAAQELFDSSKNKFDSLDKSNVMNQISSAMSQAVQSANTEVGEVNSFMKAWGLHDGNKENRVTYQDKTDALNRLKNSEKLKKLTELIGKFKNIVSNELRKKSTNGTSSVKSVKTGDKLQDLLPSEMVNLTNQKTKKDFMRRYTEKNLLVYEKDSNSTSGRGPIITCCDVSGSMFGKPEQWSKALSLAMLEIAQKQRRAYAYISFDNRIQDVYKIPYGSLKHEMVFDIAEKFSGGGTDFEQPLREALKIMESQKFKKGDILFITDGYCSLDDEFIKNFNRVKKEKDFKVRTVLINAGTDASCTSIAEFSDDIVYLSNIADLNDKNATKIFQDTLTTN